MLLILTKNYFTTFILMYKKNALKRTVIYLFISEQTLSIPFQVFYLKKENE